MHECMYFILTGGLRRFSQPRSQGLLSRSCTAHKILPIHKQFSGLITNFKQNHRITDLTILVLFAFLLFHDTLLFPIAICQSSESGRNAIQSRYFRSLSSKGRKTRVFLPSLPWGGEMKDPGNEVEIFPGDKPTLEEFTV